ncbi:IclR family transcriptional regulator [Pseudonocardia sp. WMMC193]|uniref:IclR family transcriptional regulator n=1 Tax=Pseudonocardia sp. WMMC193 TaxID=2911965 RepID=UPI001F2D5B43|nr:IclR family transcriptional regulator [Pseudonocardia sp. WMMC193]MCF7550640.1 IclR family transcriptional regulator [Pseudonocardia sp. WMMC193]
MRSTQRDGGPISVVGRAFGLLAAFQPTDGALSLSELARRTGLSKATVHRLVHQMAEQGAVEISAEGVRVGTRLFELGQLAARPRSLRDAAAPHLADLREATGETVHLAVSDGAEVLYVQKLESRRVPDVESRVGGRMPLYCTAVGKVLLAHAPADVVREVLAGPLERRTPRTVVAPGLLERELARIRETGVGEEREESTVGVACVASPVFATSGEVVAAVSITGRSTRIDPSRLAPAVRTTALGISRSLRSAAPDLLDLGGG